ncbi:hypothetical protein SLOPH_1774 [Spraguea lophii 42_110]|uniref:Palmitoyltransferase n=1 Tax=Spraguea lophii (strain 42_110) TaxID=1358809 RepID=S7WB63_SPRLO|nr:hypothetical protein SLOPH_1774 [Spraguea lophii 42_110]
MPFLILDYHSGLNIKIFCLLMGSNKEKNTRFIIVILLIFYLHLIPQALIVIKKEMKKLDIAMLLILNGSSLMIYIYIYLCKTNGGKVEMNDEMDYLLFKSNGSRYCRKCDNFKPERAHHCSRCKSCIKKMDHHCDWLLVCVNSDNHGYFIRLLFFCLLSMLINMFWLMYTYIVDFKTKRFHWILNILFILHFVLNFFFFVVVSVFFYYRVKEVLLNMTYIEHEKYKDVKAYGMECRKSPYDLGYFKNLEQALGKFYFLYLYGENCDGINFKKTYEITTDWPPFKFRNTIAETVIPV